MIYLEKLPVFFCEKKNSTVCTVYSAEEAESLSSTVTRARAGPARKHSCHNSLLNTLDWSLGWPPKHNHPRRVQVADALTGAHGKSPHTLFGFEVCRRRLLALSVVRHLYLPPSTTFKTSPPPPLPIVTNSASPPARLPSSVWPRSSQTRCLIPTRRHSETGVTGRGGPRRKRGRNPRVSG